MRTKLFAAAVGLALATWPAAAQESAAVQLQKGIFAQQTTGDLDAAIQIFRQIIASNPVERVYAAQAQMHLAQALLQKGDLNGAATEFNVLAANYSEFHDAVAAMAGRMAGVEHGRTFSSGTATLSQGEPERYQNSRTGVTFTMPSGWRLEGDGASSSDGEIVMFSTTSVHTDLVAAWMKPRNNDAGQIPGLLRGDLNRKHLDRTDFGEWTIRPESVQTRTVAGQQALSAVADYAVYNMSIQADSIKWEGRTMTAVNPKASSPTKPEATRMVEYLIWVRTPKTHVQFFGRAKLEDLAALESGMDQLAANTVIP
ncbi:MAG TPA: hypothetical protein VKB88_07425 [Bryobacteraceae bacterium]|nr:hypothetical protein [Bryobacteraceae bacterium]